MVKSNQIVINIKGGTRIPITELRLSADKYDADEGEPINLKAEMYLYDTVPQGKQACAAFDLKYSVVYQDTGEYEEGVLRRFTICANEGEQHGETEITERLKAGNWVLWFEGPDYASIYSIGGSR